LSVHFYLISPIDLIAARTYNADVKPKALTDELTGAANWGKKESLIKRTKVKRKSSSGPENQAFTHPTKILDNSLNFLAFFIF
jgi:hypothetical protein